EQGGDLEAVLSAALGSGEVATRQIVREELRAELLRPGADPGSPEAVRNLARVAAQLVDDGDRPHAALALADVVERHGARAASQATVLLAHRDDRDARVRTAVLRFIGAAGLVGEAGWATRRLAALDAAEAAAAQGALRAFGSVAVDALCETLRSGRMTARVRALSVLRALEDEGPLFEELIDREVDTSFRLLMQAEVLRTGGVPDIVLRYLRERIEGSAHTALLLLAAVLNDERVGRVSDLLRTAGDGRARAVLLEALEAALPPEEGARLLPLLDDEHPRAIA